MCSFTTTRSACPKASRALSLVCSKNASSDFAASLSSPSKTFRKACCALSLACSRNASSEPSSASSLPSCPWRLSANAFNSSVSFPERAPLAEAAQFHLLYCVPLRLQHDLLPNIGLLAIQQSVLQVFACFKLGLLQKSIIRVCSSITIKQYIFQGFMSFELGVSKNASSESAASSSTENTFSKASHALSWPAPGKLDQCLHLYRHLEVRFPSIVQSSWA